MKFRGLYGNTSIGNSSWIMKKQFRGLYGNTSIGISSWIIGIFHWLIGYSDHVNHGTDLIELIRQQSIFTWRYDFWIFMVQWEQHIVLLPKRVGLIDSTFFSIRTIIVGRVSDWSYQITHCRLIFFFLVHGQLVRINWIKRHQFLKASNICWLGIVEA